MQIISHLKKKPKTNPTTLCVAIGMYSGAINGQKQTPRAAAPRCLLQVPLRVAARRHGAWCVNGTGGQAAVQIQILSV